MGLGLLLALSAFFSGSETALCALSRAQVERLRADSRKSSQAIVRFVDDPRRLFITILLGNTFINISFATLTAALIYGLFGTGPSGPAIAIATLSITLALLVFGEITPKTFAIRHAERFAGFTAPILWGFSIVISPLRRVLRVVTDLLLPLFGGVPAAATQRITSEDLKALIEEQGHSSLAAEERVIMERILDLREIDAREIMVPRTEMVAMRSSATIGEVLDRASEVGFSRIPIYHERLDDMSGVLRVKDWLSWREDDLRDLTVREFMDLQSGRADGMRALLVHPAFFAPDSSSVVDLFAELSSNGRKVAFLVDEFGGIAGSVTVEDIVEEVVGEIADEHDTPAHAADLAQRPEDPTAYDVTGRASVRLVNRKLNLQMDEDLADTVGGYVVACFGRIPDVGETFLHPDGVLFEVVESEGFRVTAVTIFLPAEGP
jgi:putative hemolysin